MAFVFSIDKAVQVAGFLLKLQTKRAMPYIKLLKLLYIADREALAKAGMPITGDKPFAMKDGPVLSRIYDLIRGVSADAVQQEQWSHFIRTEGMDVALVQSTPSDELSDFEIDILTEVHRNHGSKWKWALRNETHHFGEWKKNYRAETSTPIPLADILDAVGRAADFEEIDRERREEEQFASLLRE